jgi:uncharacterized protein YbjT (DUF2867 family)
MATRMMALCFIQSPFQPSTKGTIMFVLLGSNGNITSKAARILISQGKRVKVVGRSENSLADLKAAGAEIAIGDVADPAFLTAALRGADAAYTMIPPNYATTDMHADYDRYGAAIASAIAASGVKQVVNLSSVGAHLPSGTGPIVGLHRQEQRLNKLEGVNILHLRPGYFFENHFNAIGTIKAMNVYADMTDSNALIPMIGTGDIAVVVARELASFKTRGKAILHLRSPRYYSQSQAAAILGAAIGKPDLKHVRAEPAAAKAGMVQHGLSQDVADKFEEMSNAFNANLINNAVDAGPTEITPTTLDAFAASVFAPAYKAA